MNRFNPVMQQHTLNTPYIIGEVHCYSTEINNELVLFDAGPPTDDAFATLAAQIDLQRLKYIFITHTHIDHYGLAARIVEQSGARVLVSRQDAIKFQRRRERLDLFIKLLAGIGCDDSITSQLREKKEQELLAIKIPEQIEIVEESTVPATLGISWLNCPGHSQSDLIYLCGNSAITGDTLLRNIFQVPIFDVDLQTFAGRFHNYDAYCTSIMAMRHLRGYRICPGHRWHVDSFEETILCYVRKLLERAGQIKELSPGNSPLDIMLAIFGDISRNPFFVHMKLSEIIFIQDFLENPAQLKKSLEFLGLFDTVSDLYYSATGEADRDCQQRFCPA